MIIPAQDPNAGRLEDIEGNGKPPQRGRLPARDHQAVEAIELLGAAHRDRFRADCLERAQVLGDVALKGEHPDDRSCGRLHRSSRPDHGPRLCQRNLRRRSLAAAQHWNAGLTSLKR
jgi:hypothetical protein